MTVQTEGEDARATHLIAVQVSFPVSRKGPYRSEVTLDTTVGTVRQAVMTFFEVADGGQYTYVLTHGGQEESDATTIGQIAGDKKRSVESRLVKKITQG